MLIAPRHLLIKISVPPIQQALEPLKQQLEAFRTRIDEMHTAETNQGGELRTELRQLQTLNIQLRNEAENLVRALKNEPQTRGIWGELILERTMQIAGLNKAPWMLLLWEPCGSMQQRRIELCWRTHLERRCSLANSGRGRLRAAHRPKGRHLPEQAESVKSQRARGTESRDSFGDTVNKTEFYVSVFFGGITVLLLSREQSPNEPPLD